MDGRTRKTAAAGAAAFVLAGTAVLATPGTAAAATIPAQCGQTVTASPGDIISTPFGPQTVTNGLTSLVGNLLTGLCTITVNVVNTAVAPVPVVGAPVAGAVNNTVSGATNGATSTLQGAASMVPGAQQQQPSQQQPPSGGSQQSGPNGGNAPANQGSPGSIPSSNSPVLGGDPAAFSVLPFSSLAGFAPMRDYSGIPYALAGLWSPSPGLRYGGQIPGYAPEVGALGQGNGGGNSVQNAGQAESMSGATNGPNPVGLPMLIAVLSLSGVSAALVRRWVLRGATA
ncbi:hypothetical protein HFP15_10130 [Amycolatopsis sp. K13G38]|uniref:DUF320 domain-containing protein n=1 Tax=Amycolatopsis acididurans TaxID=2724524 RepID=A0ABX1J4K0_9PSEU|nr:hypothetical protein [Amycolatopsis acididurans]NKQ53240.1 hypothetical protein [Amycolatopsis acididurans]